MRRSFCLLFILVLSMTCLVVGHFRLTAVAAQDKGGPSTAARVLELVNEERWQQGQLPPLKGEETLHDSATTHSTNMALRDFFDHCDFDTGDSPWDRMNAAGYSGWNFAGENIAAGFDSPEGVMSAWLGSSGHRANILSTNFREIGIGYYHQVGDGNNIRESENNDCQPDSANNGPYHHYWTQNFGRRSDIMPLIINREAYETDSRAVNLFLYGAGWAQSMRLRNSDGTWTEWQAFSENPAWLLSCGLGEKSVITEISGGPNGSGTVRTTADDIMFTGESNSLLNANVASLAAVINPSSPAATVTLTMTVTNDGNTAINWTLSEQPAVNWLSLSSSSGILSPCQEIDITVTLTSANLTAGAYSTSLILDGDIATNTPQALPVTFLYTDLPPTTLPLIKTP